MNTQGFLQYSGFIKLTRADIYKSAGDRVFNQREAYISLISSKNVTQSRLPVIFKSTSIKKALVLGNSKSDATILMQKKILLLQFFLLWGIFLTHVLKLWVDVMQ